MIDTDGFRPNVGIVLARGDGSVLWARRVGGQDAWQFPQGGIKEHESAEQALFRELREEVGLRDTDVDIKAVTQGWLRYRLPQRLVRQKEPLCVGQKQKWFLLHLRSDDSDIKLNAEDGPPEFDYWRWVSYWYPLTNVVAFKREVYRRALKELAPAHNRLITSLSEAAC
ncbi:putative (di)nucleoside polyphosphate hydrolase [Alteromonadaceae bacterium Bs31]|nr:putative (di)nucleoside polyphosphate hydrolase [Alteromonadaceae bacterium Bs31]